MAVKIRMKKLGRKHRPFFRICATDSRSPRDGRVIEELGTYDTSVPETDARCTLNGERIQYWLGVGAQPSEKVGVLIKKYGLNGTHLEAQAAARARLVAPKEIADPGEPAFKMEPRAPAAPPKAEKAEPAEAASEPAETETAATESAEQAEGAVEQTTATEETPAAEEAPAEEPAAEQADTEASAGEGGTEATTETKDESTG